MNSTTVSAETITELLEACRAGLAALDEIYREHGLNYSADATMLRAAIAKATEVK